MLQRLRNRAQKLGLAERIETRACQEHTLGLQDMVGAVDFVLTFAMVHEVPDPARLFAELAAVLKPTGRWLLSEPSGHVKAADFQRTLELGQSCGLRVIATPQIRSSRSIVFTQK
jgi:SAM-dependent methyltransferase